MTDRFDLVVAGAGGGLAGALRAAELGLSVLVVEASLYWRIGNNTAMSTAMIPGAGSRFQRAQGVHDSPAVYFEDIVRKTKGQADRRLARALTDVSARLVEWLADHVELPIQLVTDFQYPGHSRLRCHTVPGRSGKRILDGLHAATQLTDRITFYAPARLREVDNNTRDACSVVLEDPAGSSVRVVARFVLLATGGFGANGALISQFLPRLKGVTYHGSPEARGDALRIGVQLGAATAFLDAYQGHAALALPHATLVSWATVMHGAILVNLEGRRFGDETVGYSEFAETVDAQPDRRAFVILDRRIHDLCLSFDDFRRTVEAGAVRWAESPEALAAALGVNEAGLSATFEEARSIAAGAMSDPLGRRTWERPLEPPLAGVSVGPALFHTQGGLCVDEHARVLDEGGEPIPGVFAAGGAAIGISGHGAAGYLAGNGLLPALGLAFLAAEEAGRSFDAARTR